MRKTTQKDRDYYGYYEYKHPYKFESNGSGKATAIVGALNSYRRTHWLVRLMQDTRSFLKKKITIKIERN